MSSETGQNFNPEDEESSAPVLPYRPPQRNVGGPSAYDPSADFLSAEFLPDPIPEEILDRVNQGEIINPNAEYLDVFNLTPEQQEKLSQDLVRWNGVLRIFVHPYWALKEYEQRFQEIQLRIDHILSRVLNKHTDERPPVLFMEEFVQTEALYQYIKGINADTVYIAPTFLETSQPYPDDNSECSPRRTANNNENWQKLVGILTGLGVKKIIIGGQSFSLISRRGPGYGDCVGHAINNLKTHFDVKLSNASTVTRSQLPTDSEI